LISHEAKLSEVAINFGSSSNLIGLGVVLTKGNKEISKVV
jgi:hypothetical protein